MSTPKPSADFHQRFQGWFWWTAPISLIADLIAIAAVFNVQQQYQAAQSAAPANTPLVEPRVLYIIPVSDAVFLTGLFTAFTIISMIYHGYRRSRTDQNLWSIMRWSFLSIVLAWIYLRLWLHEYWWACGFISVIAILLAVGFALFRLPMVTGTPGSDSANMLQLLKLGCVGVGVIALMVIGFFFVSTGTLANVLRSLPTVIPPVANASAPRSGISPTGPATVATAYPTADFSRPAPGFVPAQPTSLPITNMPVPDQFVRTYYGITDRDDMTTAWSMLSPKFKRKEYPECDPTSSSPCYSLVHFFSRIDSTYIQQATTVYSTTDSALADVTLCFVRYGRCINPFTLFHFFLVADSTHMSWLIDEVK